MPEPQPATTVMIARHRRTTIEFYLLRRSSRSAFMPDVYVFPGGRIEPHDAAPRAREQLAGETNSPEPAWVYAAARETFEECGLLFASRPVDAPRLAEQRGRLLAGTTTFTELLDALDTGIDAAALRYFSRWITPSAEPRRFDTHFFVARAPDGQVASADAQETHDGQWIAPREALARSAAGDFALSLPTVKHLERVGAFDDIDALLAYAAQKPVRTVMPEPTDGRFAIPAALEGAW
jgi:8-oxo-dGTP pyrophosphatase MutT (NUDIX family)